LTQNHNNLLKFSMNNLESYLLQKIAPYDQKLKELTKSISDKDAELGVLGLAYKDLLNTLEGLVGPEKYLDYVKQANLVTNYVDDLSPEEQLIMIKMFDFTVPIPESDHETAERIKTFKALIQKTNLKDLLNSPLFLAITRSPEFEMIINTPDFGAIAGNHEVTALIRAPKFKKLATSEDFQELLRRNGLVLPLRPFDLQLPLKLSMLKSIARLDRIFEDFKTNRCASPSTINHNDTTRNPLIQKMSPRKTGNSFLDKTDYTMVNKTNVLESKLLQHSYSMNANSSTNSPFRIRHDI